jgi:hypothetical protein
MEIQDGETEMLTVGIKLTVAVSTGAEGAEAMIVTLLVEVMLDGAVYCPATVMLPELGLIDQVYRFFPAFCTENIWTPDAFRVTVLGAIDCACRTAIDRNKIVNTYRYVFRMVNLGV